MKKIKFNSIDGTDLVGDFYSGESSVVVFLVHGITANRKEDGLYKDICNRLQEKKIGSFSIDLRAHGDSEGKQEELTLSGCINDIFSGIQTLIQLSHAKNVIVIASSFSGGLAVYASHKLQPLIQSIILFNPRLDYTPWIKNDAFWVDGAISKTASKILRKKKYLMRNDFKIGRPMLNEILCFNPSQSLQDIKTKILFIHGTDDSVVSIAESESRFNENRMGRLVKIEGADHGFVSPTDERASSEVNRKFRELVITNTIEWIDEITKSIN